MINLLPPDIKEGIFYGRRNTRLRNWITAAIIALVGIGLLVAGGLVYMQQAVKNQTSQVEQSKQDLQTQKVDETQKRVEEISSNTKLAVDVLSREVLFSKLIRQIGSALPANTALQSLQIDAVQGGIQLNALAADFNAGTQLQLNLQDPRNGVFEKADINSITCADPSDPNGAANNQGSQPAQFPCEVSLQALFSKNNSYVYIAPKTPDGTQPEASQ
jgi:Tfp pilus assembly protein PilN